jgi:hypothetical protein
MSAAEGILQMAALPITLFVEVALVLLWAYN